MGSRNEDPYSANQGESMRRDRDSCLEKKYALFQRGRITKVLWRSDGPAQGAPSVPGGSMLDVDVEFGENPRSLVW